MATDAAAILKRAKELCAQNGTVWDTSESVQGKKGEKIKGILDEKGRQQYLARARAELGAGDA